VQLHLQQLWLWLPHVHLQQVPWMKLLSLAALWLGFMGLTALSGLLPLCSWSYVSYLLLFMGITGCVTATLIQVRRHTQRGCHGNGGHIWGWF
jgi:hypothetical protein